MRTGIYAIHELADELLTVTQEGSSSSHRGNRSSQDIYTARGFALHTDVQWRSATEPTNAKCIKLGHGTAEAVCKVSGSTYCESPLQTMALRRSVTLSAELKRSGASHSSCKTVALTDFCKRLSRINRHTSLPLAAHCRRSSCWTTDDHRAGRNYRRAEREEGP